MTLNQLKYVVEVAKTGSINKAASNLFISQSVLSTAISGLEKEIGHAIFMRSNRGVSLTPFGHTFISYVAAIQTQLQQLNTLIQRGSGRHEFSLSVASTGYYFLSRICAELFEKYRSMGVRVEQYEDHENNVADMVANQTVELGIVRLWSCYKNSYIKQLHSRKLQYYTVAKLDVAVTVGPKSPLFHQEKDYVTCADLKECPSVMYSNIDSGPYADIYERLHLPVSNSRFVTSSRSTIYEILSNTECYYLNSVYPFDILDAGQPSSYAQYHTLRLADCAIQSEIAWIKREDYAMSPLANEVVNMIMRYFADIISI